VLGGAGLLVGLGIGLVFPALATVAADLAASDERGAVLGLAQSSGGLGRTVGPLCAGLLFEHLGPAAPFLAGGVVAAGALCLALAMGPAAGDAAPGPR
jgi:MFS family permease